MRWSKVFRTRQTAGGTLQGTDKVVVFGGGSFGTAMGASLAGQRPDMEVVLLLRDPYLCLDINTKHCNTKYLKVSRQGGQGQGPQGTQTAHTLPTAAGLRLKAMA